MSVRVEGGGLKLSVGVKGEARGYLAEGHLDDERVPEKRYGGRG